MKSVPWYQQKSWVFHHWIEWSSWVVSPFILMLSNWVDIYLELRQFNYANFHASKPGSRFLGDAKWSLTGSSGIGKGSEKVFTKSCDIAADLAAATKSMAACAFWTLCLRMYQNKRLGTASMSYSYKWVIVWS